MSKKRVSDTPLDSSSQPKNPRVEEPDGNAIADKYWPEFQRLGIIVREVEIGTDDYSQLTRIRTEVFVGEQNVSEKGEFDGLDEQSVHLGLRKNDVYIGTCRLRLKRPFVKLERVCIVKSMRGNGYAEFLCRNAGRVACQKWPDCLLVAHAQSYSLGLYKKIGAMVVSTEFVEEGIPHQAIAFLFRHNFAISNYTIPEEKNGFGIDDPETLQTIRRTLALIQSCRVVAPLDVFSKVAPYTHEIGVWFQTLVEYMSLVCTLNREEFKASYGKIQESDRKLIEMVQHKLYVGHYSNVQSHWRVFAYVVGLLSSVSFFPNFDDQREFLDRLEALERFDKGLCYGEKRADDNEFIIKRVAVMKETLPLIQLELPQTRPLDIPVSLPHSRPITESRVIPEEEFLETYIVHKRPVLIKKGAQMKAVGSWTLPYLAEILTGRAFPVEQGYNYADDDFKQSFMGAEQFFYSVTDPNEEVYLAQHRLLEQIPELLDDVKVPPYSKATGLTDEDVDINVWIGPAGTVSPLHSDPKDNVFCQVSGKKFFRLINPEHAPLLHLGEDIQANTSKVDVGNPDLDECPNFANIECFDTVVDEGDLLYIPKGWFHYVKSLTPSSSLSFWFDSSVNISE